MNIVITSLVLVVSSCVVNGYHTENKTCSDILTAFPPNPETECCGRDGDGATEINQYPWLALIEYEPRYHKVRSICGGILISAKYVLSAALGVTGRILRKIQPKYIQLGEYNIKNEGPDCIESGDTKKCNDGLTRIPIEEIISHPQYNEYDPLFWGNIALIRMETNAPYTEFIRPICLPTQDLTLTTEPLYLIKAGWGDVLELSPVKLQVKLPLYDPGKCEKKYSIGTNQTFLKQFCAGSELGKDSCEGDSGMPLMYRSGDTFTAIGIVSYGWSVCGQADEPSVYTNIYEYKDWINEHIAD